MTTSTTASTPTLELCEARAWSDLYRATSPEVARRVGAGLFTVGSATAVVTARIDILAYNRVIGLGLDGGRSRRMDDSIDTIVAAYRSMSARRFFVQVAPGAEDGVVEQLTTRGFNHYNNWTKLVRGTRDVPVVESDLRVEEIGPERAREFGDVFATAFEWPAVVSSWVAALVGRPGWRHYLACDGGRAVATAAMRVDGDTAWIDFASTLPEYRGRGAQSALIARRIADCADAGVGVMVVETAETSPSRRNLERLGFETAYLRPNYLLELD